jgi:hypothetical protein
MRRELIMGKMLLSNLSLMLVLLFAVQGCAMGSGPGPATITGTIRLVGNVPFARIVLTPTDSGRGTKEQDYLLIGPLQDELRKQYQGRLVTLEGTPCASPTPQFGKCFEPTRIIVR